jgi:serine phosphatase RsbU (regulator of sigma subunit)
VGGDYFTYIPLAEGRLMIIVADVCGKGLPAALEVAQLQGEVRHALAATSSAKAIMRQLNRFVWDSSAMLITFVMCVLDPRKHELTVLNAGHYAPLRRATDGTVTELGRDKSGVPLGIDLQADYHPAQFRVEPGECILLFTDGICDAVSAKDERYGNDRIVRMVSSAPAEARGLLETVIKDVQHHSRGSKQADDICAVCFHRLPAGQGA